MSSGSRKGARVSSSSSSSIPDSVRKMIQNIREITAAHDDDEIYATLKDCSMDPNETAQRLLSQDTFQEVKKKRDRRKENSGNKEEPKWKPGQGRGGRSGRGNYLPRHTSNDTGGRNSLIGKENTSNQASEKIAGISSSSSSLEPKKNEATATRSSATAVTNGPSAIVSKGINSDISKLVSPTPNEHINIEKENSGENSETQITSPGSHFSSSDPVLVPSQDPRIPGAAGAIKRQVGCQPTPADQISIFPSEGKTFTATSEVEKCSMEGNIKSIRVGINRQSENTIRPSSAHGGSSLVRPSSNHSSRSQQVVGPPKVVPAKEWKPKSTNPNLGQGSSTADKSISAAMEADISKSLDPKEASAKLQRKLDEPNISNNQPVIIPNHLNVHVAEKISFCFGSFDAISLETGFKNVPEDSNHSLPSETYENVVETEEQTSTLETALATAEEEDHHGHFQLPENVPENASPNEHSESKQEREIPQVSHQYPIIHSPGYGFGLLPTMMGSQLPPFENSESQTRDGSCVPSFVVPQPFDPASYYAQFHRSTGEGDGRVATKYNGNAAVLPPQTSQSAQEGGNSVMSTSGPTTFVTQPSSIAVTQQQPVPVFRQPYGFPFPHYPQNLINYSPYFSPYFVPHFPQPYNNVYPQQPQAGGVYQAPPGLSPKFSISQYKSGTSSGNSTSVGVASTNEDLNAQHFKENNVYIPGQQQSEGSAVWLTQPGRDISGLQANSFYNIPLPQPGHGPFTVHPFLQQSQPISTVDLSGPPSNVYQQPQHTQVTWPNNNY